MREMTPGAIFARLVLALLVMIAGTDLGEVFHDGRRTVT